jgi:hypothetical protein
MAEEKKSTKKNEAKPLPYLVLRDTREQQGWEFPAKAPCLGTELATLKTGDYTLKGYEGVFVVERKFSTGEIAQNIVQDRFERELQRLEEFRFPFLVCEFTLADIISFPANSGIPKFKWRSLRITPQFLMKRLNEFQLRYKTRLTFAGIHGREFVSSLFKRITENVQPSA